MFTGIVTAVGTVRERRDDGEIVHVRVEVGPLAERARLGDSIALSGVCCTVVALDGTTAGFDLTPETLRRTWFGDLAPGRRVNVEGALLAGEPFGGHLVQGHVDAVGAVVTPIDPEAGGELVVRLPDPLLRYVVEKGSLTLDGVSLTVAALAGAEATIAVIPHTARVTTLGTTPAGAPLHVEVDVLAKYVERLLAAR